MRRNQGNTSLRADLFPAHNCTKKDSIDSISVYFRYPNSQINDAFKSVLKSKTNCCQ